MKKLYSLVLLLSIINLGSVSGSEQQEKQNQEQEHLYQGFTLEFKNLRQLLKFTIFLNTADNVLFDIIETDFKKCRLTLDFGEYLNTQNEFKFVFNKLARRLKIKINYMEFMVRQAPSVAKAMAGRHHECGDYKNGTCS